MMTSVSPCVAAAEGAVVAAGAGAAAHPGRGRGLHSSTSQLNLSRV